MLDLSNKIEIAAILPMTIIPISKYNNWLCGCDVRNAVFCFPCFLFGREFSWIKTVLKFK